MIRFDMNGISIAGLVIGALAAVLYCVQLFSGTDLSMGELFGPRAPFAHVPLYMIVALLGLVTYAVGRLVWLVRNRFGAPPPPRRR